LGLRVYASSRAPSLQCMRSRLSDGLMMYRTSRSTPAPSSGSTLTLESTENLPMGSGSWPWPRGSQGGRSPTGVGEGRPTATRWPRLVASRAAAQQTGVVLPGQEQCEALLGQQPLVLQERSKNGGSLGAAGRAEATTLAATRHEVLPVAVSTLDASKPGLEDAAVEVARDHSVHETAPVAVPLVRRPGWCNRSTRPALSVAPLDWEKSRPAAGCGPERQLGESRAAATKGGQGNGQERRSSRDGGAYNR